jgi:hypothetical protein
MNSPMEPRSGQKLVNDSSIKDSKINININIQQKINLNTSMVRKAVGNPLFVTRDLRALKKSPLSKTFRKSSTMDTGKRKIITEEKSVAPEKEPIK